MVGRSIKRGQLKQRPLSKELCYLYLILLKTHKSTNTYCYLTLSAGLCTCPLQHGWGGSISCKYGGSQHALRFTVDSVSLQTLAKATIKGKDDSL